MGTMGWGHLSPNPNLAMDMDPFDSHTPHGLAPMRMNWTIGSTIYPYEWIRLVGHG